MKGGWIHISSAPVEVLVVSESWWKLAFGVAPDVDHRFVKRRGQAAVRSVPGPGLASHRPCAW